ncbi:alpha/beta hydrolase [uncultured Treponema sp.]|uniref:alpha/beta hydrolase n=1 Tax=uncultured Treponema sp. TaxID=162155 RepID=UPI0025E8F68B|nr:alpha/beta hydrolase [uncultured Treponema sp.]
MLNNNNLSFEEKIKNLRISWEASDKKRDAGLTEPEHLKTFYNISYGPHGESNLLDIYMPDNINQKNSTIVNIHGGAWIYGSKEIYKFYCMALATRGFVVVNINYRLAPENLFPKALEDINQALTFIEKHGEEYCVDKENLILVGDSAGGQLTSHYAAIFTNPEFAKLYDFTLPNIKIRAVGLNCGLYNPKSAILNSTDSHYKIYLGEDANYSNKELMNKIDVFSHITSNFPPAFITSSYRDFLLHEAQPMYDLLKSKGVEAEIKIYGNKDNPKIAHVFHVNCKLPEAKLCNDEECEFFRRFIN